VTISSRKLGPGQLELGATPLEVNAQLTACKVTPSENVSTTEATKVLSGEQLDGDEDVTHAYVLEGTFLQDDGGVASVVDWTWTNAGTEQPARFVPNDAGGRQVSGTIVVVPLTIGGDEVGARMSSDFTWRFKGTPVLAPVAP
jgi:hypothetical protein